MQRGQAKRRSEERLPKGKDVIYSGCVNLTWSATSEIAFSLQTSPTQVIHQSAENAIQNEYCTRSQGRVLSCDRLRGAQEMYLWWSAWPCMRVSASFAAQECDREKRAAQFLRDRPRSD